MDYLKVVQIVEAANELSEDYPYDIFVKDFSSLYELYDRAAFAVFCDHLVTIIAFENLI